MSELSPGASMHAFGDIHTMRAFGEGAATSLVTASVTLDELWRRSFVSRPTAIKIDVDGAELDVLEGGAALIADGVTSMMVEVNWTLADAVHPRRVVDWCVERGFALTGRGVAFRRNQMHWQNMYFSKR